MKSKYVATSLGQFLRKIAIDYVRHGYYWYQLYTFKKDFSEQELERIDTKIIKEYEITYHRTTRARRKKQGIANVAYVRWSNYYILLFTDGFHYKKQEGVRLSDMREVPLQIFQYEVRVLQGKGQVRINPDYLKRKRRSLLKSSYKGRGEVLKKLHRLGYLNYPEINRQKFYLLKAINKKRRKANKPRIIIFKNRK